MPPLNHQLTAAVKLYRKRFEDGIWYVAFAVPLLIVEKPSLGKCFHGSWFACISGVHKFFIQLNSKMILKGTVCTKKVYYLPIIPKLYAILYSNKHKNIFDTVTFFSIWWKSIGYRCIMDENNWKDFQIIIFFHASAVVEPPSVC